MQSRLIGLDALRGIAAFAVFLHHVHMSATGYSRGAAFLAVDLFFMLSGYVMARTYEARLERGWKAGSFLWVRIKRLWPTMTVGAALGVPIVLVTYGWATGLPALVNILFIPYFIGPRAFPLNGPAWSIFFELIANALHAVLLYRLSNRHLAIIILLCAPLLVISGRDYGLDVGSRPESFLGGLPRVLLSYTIGILLFRIWQDRPSIAVSPGFTLLAMPLFFVGSAFIGGQSWQANLVFILAVCPLMIAGALSFRVSRFWSGIAVLAGAMSFPLYAVHGVALRLGTLLGYGWVFGATMSILIVLGFPSVRRELREVLPGPRSRTSLR